MPRDFLFEGVRGAKSVVSRQDGSREAGMTAWRALRAAGETAAALNLTALFEADAERVQRWSLSFEGILVDLSKQDIDAAGRDALLALADAMAIADKRDAMARGDRVNQTEGRAALHMALRGEALLDDSRAAREIKAAVAAARGAMKRFASEVRTGLRRGATDRPFTDIVNIGIGGSDLGPKLVVDALGAEATGPRAHFISNLDAAALGDLLPRLDPETTLVVICSKTFTTLETMTNAVTARAWLTAGLSAVGAEVSSHLAAATANAERAVSFGVPPAHIFAFGDWVGGRFSLWSSAGISAALALGPKAFDALLEGAQSMDAHFLSAPFERNLPVMLALSDLWQRVVRGRGGRAVAVYNERLRKLPGVLQQIEMESNGKRATLGGELLQTGGAGVVWGGLGCDAQHAFFQMLHQGPEIIPVEFIVSRMGAVQGLERHHDRLLANCFAQSRALMTGRSEAEAAARLVAEGRTPSAAERLAPHLACPGDRPSTTILFDRVEPRSLGQLLALAEHRAFVFGALLDLNPFDQYGVELGKSIAGEILARMAGQKAVQLDPSTEALLASTRRVVA